MRPDGHVAAQLDGDLPRSLRKGDYEVRPMISASSARKGIRLASVDGCGLGTGLDAGVDVLARRTRWIGVPGAAEELDPARKTLHVDASEPPFLRGRGASGYRDGG